MNDDLERYAPEVDLEIDPGIRRAVLILRRAGVETFESCEGGEGHAFPEPTIKFNGGQGAGFHALSVALDYDLPVSRLQRCYYVQRGELEGPWWELVFHTKGLSSSA